MEYPHSHSISATPCPSRLEFGAGSASPNDDLTLGTAVGSNSALHASLAEVKSAFDFMRDSYDVSGPDSPESAEALRRYEFAELASRTEYESATEDGRLSGIDNHGLG